MKPSLFAGTVLIVCGSVLAQTPSPVPSTIPGDAFDSLNLTKGVNITAINPTIGGDANSRRAFNLNVTTDSATSNSNFSDELGEYINFDVTNGQNVSGGLPAEKKPFFPFLTKGS